MKNLILLAAVCAVLLMVTGAEASSVVLQGGFGYDFRWVLCCGHSLDGKPFCKSLMKDDCLFYGRVVESCSECRELRESSPAPGTEHSRDRAPGE